MKIILILLLLAQVAFANNRVVDDFMKTQKLSEAGNYDSSEGKPAVLKFMVRNQTVHAIVDYVHVEKNQYVVSFHDIQLVVSTGPLTYAGYPVYSTHLLSPQELEKRGQKFQSYGAISSEEGNGFCRAAFGSEYHLAKQNPTSSRKSENDPWFLESVTCEGPQTVSSLTK